jgi:hypothetical protein
MRLENTFQVPASAEDAWVLLNDLPRVVPCMPGAELKEVLGDDHWTAVMHVKLGPIALHFDTDIKREEADAGARRVVLVAKAREQRGRGRAEAKIESSLTEGDSGTDVTIVTDLTLQGTVAQYGRGIVADVSSQLTDQFASCLADKLSAQSNGAAAATGAPAADSGTDAPAAAAGTPAPAAAPTPVKPVGGLSLGLKAMWRGFIGLFRRKPRD